MMDSREDVGHSVSASVPRKICIAAAIIKDERGRMLLVRKRGTEALIQPGGKIDEGEKPEQALRRELKEELNCGVVAMEFCGKGSAEAVNERECVVEAVIYRVKIDGVVSPAREIEEIVWVDPARPGERVMAALTRDFVMEMARRVD
jgi:8-oxo-dGTP diphosphatase